MHQQMERPTTEGLPAPLLRPFRVIAFDWDGTAVSGRTEDTTSLRQRLEALLRLGVWVVVITGTHLGHIERQFTQYVRGPHKRRLAVCANRGSQVFGFGARGRLLTIHERRATPQEERLLTLAVEELGARLRAQTGLDFGIVYDRMNRRKLDLLPGERWKDPPKAAIGRLLHEVNARLQGAGLGGGLDEALAMAREVVQKVGLADARVTSDVKHIEIGLTDKGDAAAWAVQALARGHGIAPAEVLVVGDEFGPLGPLPGSDALMMSEATQGATFASVGVEPTGVPPGVIHLPGGPQRFLEVLDAQVILHASRSATDMLRAPARPGRMGTEAVPLAVAPLFQVTGDPRWSVREVGFERLREREVESLFTVANGYVGTRGAVSEGSSVSAPGTYVAGLLARIQGVGKVPELVPAPHWHLLRVAVEGAPLHLEGGAILEHLRLLDLRHGLLLRRWRHRDDAGRVTTLHSVRFASLAQRKALVELAWVRPENYSGVVSVEGAVQAQVVNVEGDPVQEVVRSAMEDGSALLVVRAYGTGALLAVRAAADAWAQGLGAVQALATGDGAPGSVFRWDWDAAIDQTAYVEKLAVVASSREARSPAQATAPVLAALQAQGMAAVLAAHVAAWAQRWHVSDVEVEGDDHLLRALRFAAYHLISAANPDDQRSSIGPRGLTGEAYKGHVFWDTEVFMLPFYIFTWPEAARALLMFRYHTLPAARRRAAQAGYRGALFAWESTPDGDDATPYLVVSPTGEVIRIVAGEQEHHISADIAYAVWQYWQATGDDEFMLAAGAEIVLEAARFYASRVARGRDGRYHIYHVMGPDEYHEDVDDNAYTNVMARWTLERGRELASLLKASWPGRWEELAARLELKAAELARWRRIAAKLADGYDPATRLFEQFRGYYSLEEVDLAAYEPRSTPMDVILGHWRVQRTKVIKQADVLMFLALLWDQFPEAVHDTNFRYYEPRCGHGSSLSPGVHALAAARLGYTDVAERLFRQTADIDLGNNMGNAAWGVHLGAQGTLWQAAVLGFAGMRPRADGLDFDPHLPSAWQGLRFPVQWRRRLLRVRMGGEPLTVEATLESGAPMTVGIRNGPACRLETGRRYRVERGVEGWKAWEEVAA